MKTLSLLCILCLFAQFTYSQEGVSFKESKQLYLQGNSILIGNNILGDRVTKPLMDLTTPNDLVDMKYIDVDNDRTTFSSSEATITNSPENVKVKYAAVYWSGLYPFKKGILRKSGNKMVHVGRGDKDEKVNSILFKTPNGNYETLDGITIYDSFNSEAFETNKPYVCYADVTTQIQNLPNINGTYTAANIKASEGKISGGGSAGWLLYIVYEDPTQSPKYFNIYNGLVEVNKEEVELNFKGFKSKEEGNVKTTIAIGAMEGDRKIKSDYVSVWNEKTGDFIPLSNNLRDEKNFFNSSITIGDEFFEDRNPNSANTLGFDLLKMEIPNENNELFNHTTTQANFRFQGKADRYYLFFFAFETEIDSTFLLEKTESLANISTTEPIYQIQESSNGELLLKRVFSEEAVNETTEKDVPKVPKTLKKDIPHEQVMPSELDRVKQKKTEAIAITPTEKSQETNNIEVKPKKAISVTKETETIIKNGTQVQKVPEKQIVLSEENSIKNETRIRTMLVPVLEPGYYIITNAFSVQSNAENWMKTLKEKNFNPGIFINPENNLNYVYIAYGKALKPVYEKWKENKKLAYFKDIWIAEIN